MDTERCAKCGKPLQAVTCLTCGGSGSVSHWVFFKQECSACHGSGVRYQCPDQAAHFSESLRSFSPLVKTRSPSIVMPNQSRFGPRTPQTATPAMRMNEVMARQAAETARKQREEAARHSQETFNRFVKDSNERMRRMNEDAAKRAREAAERARQQHQDFVNRNRNWP